MNDKFLNAYEENEVVGYYKDKVIVRTESDKLYYCEMPQDLLFLGETMHPDDLTPVEELTNDEQVEIYKKFLKE